MLFHATVILLGFGLSAAPENIERPKLLVNQVRAPKDIPKELVDPVGEVLLASAAEHLSQYAIIGGSDIKAWLDAEQAKQLVDCQAELCYAEIAGALNARFLLASELSLVDESYILNIKLIDTQKGVSLGRSSWQVAGGAKKLLQAARLGVREVAGEKISQAQRKAVETKGVTPPSRGAIALWTSGATGLAWGGYWGARTSSLHTQSQSDPTLSAQGERAQWITNVALSAAGTSLLAGGVKWWLEEPGKPEDRLLGVGAPALTLGGTGIAALGVGAWFLRQAATMQANGLGTSPLQQDATLGPKRELYGNTFMVAGTMLISSALMLAFGPQPSAGDAP